MTCCFLALHLTDPFPPHTSTLLHFNVLYDVFLPSTSLQLSFESRPPLRSGSTSSGSSTITSTSLHSLFRVHELSTSRSLSHSEASEVQASHTRNPQYLHTTSPRIDLPYQSTGSGTRNTIPNIHSFPLHISQAKKANSYIHHATQTTTSRRPAAVTSRTSPTHKTVVHHPRCPFQSDLSEPRLGR